MITQRPGLTAIIRLSTTRLPSHLGRDLERRGWICRTDHPAEWISLVPAHASPASVLEGLGLLAELVEAVEVRE